MTRPALMFLAALGFASLAACNRSEPVGVPDAASSGEAAGEIAVPAPTPAGVVPAASGMASDAAALPGGAPLPAALQGRWGLVPADCTSTMGDAKGLLTVGPDTLRFYESTARAGTIVEQADTRIRANFAFSGEGSVWSREMLLETTDGGKTLVRHDFGGEAGEGPLTYTRCKT